MTDFNSTGAPLGRERNALPSGEGNLLVRIFLIFISMLFCRVTGSSTMHRRMENTRHSRAGNWHSSGTHRSVSTMPILYSFRAIAWSLHTVEITCRDAWHSSFRRDSAFLSPSSASFLHMWRNVSQAWVATSRCKPDLFRSSKALASPSEEPASSPFSGLKVILR